MTRQEELRRKALGRLMVLAYAMLILLACAALSTNATATDTEANSIEEERRELVEEKIQLKKLKKTIQVSDDSEDENLLLTEEVEEFVWDGPVLNSFNGRIQGPSGEETYYNLPMEGVISIMRDLGYSEEEYPYWVRDDGVKMFGDYVMCAAHLGIRPKGTILESSLGTAIVCDTGTFAETNMYQLDIAVSW